MIYPKETTISIYTPYTNRLGEYTLRIGVTAGRS